MGIDLTLTASLPLAPGAEPNSEAVLSAAEAVIRAAAGEWASGMSIEAESEDQCVFVAPLHPAASELLLVTDGRQLELLARTNGAGPGYHQFVVGLADAIAAGMGVTWRAEDETGYFESRDRAVLERTMLRWLASLCEHILGMQSDGPYFIAMPMGLLPDVEGFAATPLGPRSRVWASGVVARPESGRDFFSWWDEGETPRVLRDEALAILWSDCRWAPPRTESEHRAMVRAAGCLGSPHEADPGLDMPWREWAELLDHLGASGPMRRTIESRAAAAPKGTPIGYRRSGDMTSTLPGGWTLRVPASLSVEIEGDQWIAWDDDRTSASRPSPRRRWTTARCPPACSPRTGRASRCERSKTGGPSVLSCR